MLDCPDVTPLARPAVVIVAAFVFDEAQVTELVMSDVDWSLKCPVAVNCIVLPTATEEFAGVTAIETSVTVVLPDFPEQLPSTTTKRNADSTPRVRKERVSI